MEPAVNRSTMGQQRLNDLILLFVHKDIPLDVEAVIDRFARMKPRRMALTNDLTPLMQCRQPS